MSNTERSLPRKILDKAGLVASVFTIPTEVAGLGASVISMNPVGVVLFSGLLGMEYKQFTEHGKHPEQQSWYNPERLMDRFIGSLRFFKGSASTRMLKTETI